MEEINNFPVLEKLSEPENTSINEKVTPIEEVKILGMRRSRFRGAAIGVAVGWIVSGTMSCIGLPWVSDYTSCIIFGCAGYLVIRGIEHLLHPENIRSKNHKS